MKPEPLSTERKNRRPSLLPTGVSVPFSRASQRTVPVPGSTAVTFVLPASDALVA